MPTKKKSSPDKQPDSLDFPALEGKNGGDFIDTAIFKAREKNDYGDLEELIRIAGWGIFEDSRVRDFFQEATSIYKIKRVEIAGKDAPKDFLRCLRLLVKPDLGAS